MGTIGFIGAGNMAEAILQGLIRTTLYQPPDILVSDVRTDRLTQLQRQYGVCPQSDNATLARSVETLVLSVKPKNLAEVLGDIRDAVAGDSLVISIVAGKRIAEITRSLGPRAVIRVMPNTPALINEGASALFANEQASQSLGTAVAIFSCVGKAVVVDHESQIDVVTAVSGSGPAYFYLLMEAMIEGGTHLGLAPDVAKALVLQTAKGAGLLASKSDERGESPAVLTRKVATPGGTTEAALRAFQAGGFKDLVNTALTKACQRSEELSEAKDEG